MGLLWVLRKLLAFGGINDIRETSNTWEDQKNSRKRIVPEEIRSTRESRMSESEQVVPRKTNITQEDQ